MCARVCLCVYVHAHECVQVCVCKFLSVYSEHARAFSHMCSCLFSSVNMLYECERVCMITRDKGYNKPANANRQKQKIIIAVEVQTQARINAQPLFYSTKLTDANIYSPYI